MHDPEAFISKGFKSTAAMAIKVKLKANQNHFGLLRKNLRIIIKNILKKSNSFWLKFKSELRISDTKRPGISSVRSDQKQKFTRNELDLNTFSKSLTKCLIRSNYSNRLSSSVRIRCKLKVVIANHIATRK